MPVVVHENHERAGTCLVRIPHDAAGNHRILVGTGRHRAEHEHSDRSHKSTPMCNIERRRKGRRGKIALYFACRGHYQCELSKHEQATPLITLRLLLFWPLLVWMACICTCLERAVLLSRLSHRHTSRYRDELNIQS